MKKLYRKGTVHPSPPPENSEKCESLIPVAILALAAAANADNRLYFLPAPLFAMALRLSREEREVLAYLLLYSNPMRSSFSHQPEFRCNCFRCYSFYWVRWNSSPNKNLIHRILDDYEQHNLEQKQHFRNHKHNPRTGRNNRRNKNKLPKPSHVAAGSTATIITTDHLKPNEPVTVLSRVDESPKADLVQNGGGESEERGGSTNVVRRLVSFVGDKIWGVFRFRH